jgi:DNA polymerase-3 subunit beta
MKFVCSQEKFLDAVTTVQKAVSTRSTIPILEGILIKTCKDVLKLVGSGVDLSIESYIDAKILEEGSVVIPTRLLSEIIRKLPNAELAVNVNGNFRVRIECNKSIVHIQGLAPDEYPELPDIEEDNPLEISQNKLSKMIHETIFAVAVEETRPILTGALLEVEGEDANMVCLDGYRLAWRKEELPGSNMSQKIVIPGKSLSEVSKIMLDQDQPVSITFSDHHILFDMGYTRVVSRILEGEFINYRQIIPEDYKSRVKINTEILTSSIERASLIAREGKNNLIKFNLLEEKLIITSNSQAGDVYEEIPILLEGKELDIAFNAKYFLDILKVIEDDEIYLDFTMNTSPCVVRPINSKHYTYMLLPVRIYS